MNCGEVRDSLEMYINGELDGDASHDVGRHLKECSACRREYEEMHELVTVLKGMKGVFQPKGVFDMGKIDGFESKRKESRFAVRALAAVAGLAILFSAGFGSLLTFPALAKQVAVLPIVQDIQSLETKNETLEQQNVKMREEIDQLKIEIREIKGEKVKVVETGKPALPDQDNAQIQGIIMDFVKAQYTGDVAKMKSLATPNLATMIDERPSEFLKDKDGSVAFGSITSVAKEGDDYLIFVRISDTKKFVDSEYQENFTVKKVGDKFLIDNMEMDA